MKKAKTIPYYNPYKNFFQHLKKSSDRRQMPPLKFLWRRTLNYIFQTLAYNCPINSVRIWLQRKRGVHIGKNVMLGMHCILDNAHPEYIYIKDYADLAWSDSGAVSSECAILGTPCIFQSNKRLSFISDLENYGLVIRTHNFNDSLMLAKNILESNDSKSIWKTKRDIAIKNFTNVTNTLLNLVRGYNTSEENNLL